MKEIKENMGEWKDILFSRIRRILLKCPYYPEQSTDVMQSPLKFQWHSSQKILKVLWNHKKSLKGKVLLRKKNKAGGMTLSDFKL